MLGDDGSSEDQGVHKDGAASIAQAYGEALLELACNTMLEGDSMEHTMPTVGEQSTIPQDDALRLPASDGCCAESDASADKATEIANSPINDAGACEDFRREDDACIQEPGLLEILCSGPATKDAPLPVKEPALLEILCSSPATKDAPLPVGSSISAAMHSVGVRSMGLRSAGPLDITCSGGVHSLGMQSGRAQSAGVDSAAVCSIIGCGLFRAAMGMVVAPELARNPKRAGGGCELLERVKEKLEARERRMVDDGSGAVRAFFFDSMPEKYVEIRSIQQVMERSLLKKFLKRVADARSSVETTWHGTRAEHVESILKNGLIPALCSTGAYGKGSYVGTHAGVAHQYADPDGEGWRHMLVLLVAVGNHVVKGHQGEQAAVTAMDRLRNPTQYCFVDEDRLYISHLITYRVTSSVFHYVGGGYEDPFQRALTMAVLRAAQAERKKGLR
eukprot:gnl/TRDRNA2_/TRDRNA2_95291_c0_seq1.p1 gnl/TRDRNA2_/TRDRNA2_95291_c0~~gnl/TRDRNA2_/TRDRNA2_95291_c0_seq1.p1  ORF type:complete len:469 (-),score=79.36 gnl/TRDRNA2_/TRDRNA2_95291_c0_seq1:38-1378(-)